MKFRVISDIHVDINEKHAPSFNDDVFTVVCGDTSGDPKLSVKWINDNIKRGVGVSGNHLPYNRDNVPIQEHRDFLAKAFLAGSDFTYLDAECGIVSKEVDGILFVGTCFYSDMAIKSESNKSGNVKLNKQISLARMNDFKYGIIGMENDKPVRMTPDDYVEWNRNALTAMEKVVAENEASENPKPVVIVTHYPMVKEVPEKSLYVGNRNMASYGNDMIWWFEKHPSVKCHCCGHCHDMPKEYRCFKVPRKCGDLLVVNNSFGYFHEWHDMTFNPNRFVDTDTWDVEEIPEPDDVVKEKEERGKRMLGALSMFSAFF